MTPEDQNNTAPLPGSEQVMQPQTQPQPLAADASYQSTVIQPQVITPDNVSQTQGQTGQPTEQPQVNITGQTAPQQYSNPFANQPFLNQPYPEQSGPDQNGNPPLTPTPGQPVQHVDGKQADTKTTKRLIIALGVLFVLLALALVAYVFLIFIPNQPQNVWKTGLNRSGKAVTILSKNATEKDNLEALKKSEVNVSLAATVEKQSYSGEVNLKYDAANATGDIKVTQKGEGQADKVFTTKFMSQFKDTAQLPSFYFQFAGLKSLGVDTILPGLVPFENKWIGLDEAYLKSLGVTQTQAKDAKDKQVTSEEVSQALQTVITTSSDYMLTTNSQKAMIEQRKYVGKEKVDGKTAYHYIAGINKQHAKDYCATLAGNLVQTPLYKKLVSEDAASQKDSLTKECQQFVDDNIKDTDTFDMWIDAKYKLIYKIRFTDKEDKNSFIDIGENYRGGSDITFFITDYDASSKTNASLVMESNVKTHDSKAVLVVESKGTSPYNAKFTLEAKPFTGEIKADKPAEVISIDKLLGALGVDPSMLTTGPTKSAIDVERTTDIKALHGQVEAYYASNSRYPTLGNLNDAKWLKANMSGLDVAALKDPENTTTLLAAAPATKRYAYQPTAKDGTSCDNVKKDCVSYTLTATYSDGTTYTKQNLN